MIPLCVGLSFRTAPLWLREQLTVVPGRLPEELQRLSRLERVQEAVVLSTCNRVEWYLVADEPAAAASALLQDLASAHALDPAALFAHLTIRPGDHAARQLFRVAAGLDSAILGESEVVAQVKQAYQFARAGGAAGPILNRLFQKALHCAKEARARTRIAEGQTSVGTVVVALAQQQLGERLRIADVLLWGAGKAAEVTAHHLIKRGIGRLWIVNRTIAKAEELAARCRGALLSWEQALGHLAHVDLAIVCTHAPHYVIDAADLAAVRPVRGPQPLCLIDLAMPRNIDPRLRRWPGVRLFDLEDVHRLAQRGRTLREGEVDRCAALVERQVEQFMRWWQQARQRESTACPTVAG